MIQTNGMDGKEVIRGEKDRSEWRVRKKREGGKERRGKEKTAKKKSGKKI